MNQQFSNLPEPFVAAASVAEFLGNAMHPKTIDRWAREGRLPSHEIGTGPSRKKRLYRLSEIAEFLSSQSRVQ